MADFLIMDGEKKEVEKQKNSTDNIMDKPGKNFMDKINELLYSMQKIKIKEKVVIYRLLSTMINAGVSLVKSVSILEKQEKNPVLKKVLGKFVEELREGKNLSECMEMYPKSFDQAEIGIVKAGEKTGLLNKSLKDLADQVEKIAGISGKIKGALMYPAFIILVVIGVVIIMMVKVVPGLLDIFGDKNSLPASTQLLISMSDFLVNYWIFLIIGVFVLIVGFSIWKRTPTGTYIFDGLALKFPVFGDINQKMILSKFSRVFSGLISSGVSIVESLVITADAVGNEIYKQRILLLSKDVASGIKIWESIDGDKLFPDMIVQMIQVGEQTAKLDQTIGKVADFYDEQVDNTISVINKLLEPFILIFLAIMVGFIAIAIMQPIMNLSETVANQ